MHDEMTFTDCRLWTGDRFEPGKVTLSGAHITAIGDFEGIRGREIPCQGLALISPLIDNHVHFREPGAEAKEDFRSGSAAAAHGGVGTVLEVQNSLPLLTTPERVHAKRKLIAEKSLVQVGLYASAAESVLDHLREMADLCAGLKLFMAPSHGDEGAEGEEAIRPFFKAAAEVGITLILHAEDGRVIREATKKHGLQDPALFSKARPPQAELVAVERGLRLAREYGTTIHVFHLTTAGAVDLIADARKEGVDVTSSTCPHYLFFSDEDMQEKGALLKVFPSIKGPHDRQRLLEAIRANEVEIVSTDHAPHKPEEKQLKFSQVPAGISSVDLVLPLMSTLVARGALDFSDVMRLCLKNPAEIHCLHNETDLKEGGGANLVFFDPGEVWTVQQEDLLSQACLSPYVGMELTGRVAATILGGRIAYLDENGPLGGAL